MPAFHREPANEDQTRADAMYADCINQRAIAAYEHPEDVLSYHEWDLLLPSFAPTNETRKNV